MATKLYVGSLSETTSVQSLRELFDAFGPVTEVAVLNGYGFVHFRNAKDADTALQALDKTSFEGSHITVQVSHTKGHGYRGGGGGGGRDRSSSGGSRDDRGRGRYSDYSSSRSERDYKYDDYRGREGYDSRYRSRDYRDYYEKDYSAFPSRTGRDRSPMGYSSARAMDYYRASHYDREPPYRSDVYREEMAYSRDRYRDYERDRGRHPRY